VEFTKDKLPGKKRILIFGDSFTAGDGVSNSKRFSDLLPKLEHDLETCNFAIPGTGTDQHYLAYKEYAKDMNCDLVMIFVFVENIKRVNARYRSYFDENGVKQIYSKPFFEFNNGKLTLKGIPVDPKPMKKDDLGNDEDVHLHSGGKNHELKRIVTNLGLKSLVQKFIRYDPLFECKKTGTKEWQLMKVVILEWAAQIKVPVVVFPVPLWQHVEEFLDFKLINDPFSELKGLNGIEVHYPLQDLQRYSREERRKFRFRIDFHFTPFGHEAYAKALLGPIKEKLFNNRAV
jgi:carbamoyltransferase